MQDYQDIELIALFNKVDNMEQEDRKTIKKILKKYINAKKEINHLTKDIE